MVDEQLVGEVVEAIAPLPDVDGGLAIVIATASSPPAVAMLSTGDVAVVGTPVRVGLIAGSSVGRRLGGAFTLLVPAGDRALRVEVGSATARDEGHLVLVEGTIDDVRPTAEPPWTMTMSFSTGDPGAAPPYVRFWRDLRAWLTDPSGPPPAHPGLG